MSQVESLHFKIDIHVLLQAAAIDGTSNAVQDAQESVGPSLGEAAGGGSVAEIYHLFIFTGGGLLLRAALKRFIAQYIKGGSRIKYSARADNGGLNSISKSMHRKFRPTPFQPPKFTKSSWSITARATVNQSHNTKCFGVMLRIFQFKKMIK